MNFLLLTQVNAQSAQRNISLNFKQVELKLIIDTFGQVLKRSFLYNESILKGKTVNFVTDKKFTEKEAYSIFEAILSAEGLALIKEDDFIRIVTKNDAVRILTKSDYSKSDRKEDFFLTEVIEIRKVDVNLIRNAIQPFISQTTNITQFVPGNLFIVRDSFKNIERIKQLIKKLDTDYDNKNLEKIPLKNIKVNEVINIINKVYSVELQQLPGKNTNLVLLEPSTNSLIAVGLPDFMNKIRKFVKIMDVDSLNSSKLRVVEIKHAEISFVINTINEILKANATKPSDPQQVKTSATRLIKLPGANKILIYSDDYHYTFIKDLIRDMDVSKESVLLEIINIQNATVTEIAKVVQEIFGNTTTKAGKTEVKNDFKLITDERTNKLIILGRSSMIVKIKEIIKQFDRRIDNAAGNYRVFRLNYTTAEEIAKVLQAVTKSIIQTEKGKAPNPTKVNTEISITPDKSTNSLVIYAKSADFDILENVIKQLDIVRPQVFVEALIMEMSLEDGLNLGTSIQSAQVAEKDGEILGAGVIGTGSKSAGLTEFDSSVAGSSGAFLGVFGKPFSLNGKDYSTFNGFVTAQKSVSKNNILSSPQLMTLNNVKAKITAAQTKAFEKDTVVTSNGTSKTSFDYKDIGVELELTPQINADKSIKLEISAKYTSVLNNNRADTFTPDTFKREIQTSVLVNHNSVIALGGLISDNISTIETKVPCLGDIPIIGWLFKSKRATKEKTNLMIYISPQIISTADELKAKIEDIKNSYNESLNNKFRLNVSEEFGIPSINVENDFWGMPEDKPSVKEDSAIDTEKELEDDSTELKPEEDSLVLDPQSEDQETPKDEAVISIELDGLDITPEDIYPIESIEEVQPVTTEPVQKAVEKEKTVDDNRKPEEKL